MTRDEHREACLDLIEDAFISAIIDAGGTLDVPMRPVATAVLDSLPVARARVVPTQATEEMIEAGNHEGGIDYGMSHGDLELLWGAMSAAGDLTNAP